MGSITSMFWRSQTTSLTPNSMSLLPKHKILPPSIKQKEQGFDSFYDKMNH